MAGVNLTKVLARINNVKRDIYYDKELNLSLKLMTSLNTTLATINSGWYLPSRPVNNLALGAEYYEIVIAEEADSDIDYSKVIPRTEIVETNGDAFMVIQYFRPRGATKEWKIRIESKGKVR